MTKQELIAYLDKGLIDLSYDQGIYDLVCKSVMDNVLSKVKELKKILKEVHEVEYDEITLDLRLKLDEVKDQYMQCKFPLNFEDFIRLNCKVNKKVLNEIRTENDKNLLIHFQEEVERLKMQLKNNEEITSYQITTLNKENKDLKKDLKVEQEKNKKLDKENVKLKKLEERDKLIIKLSNLLSEDVKTMNFNAIINALSELERKYIAEDKLGEVKTVLAAKYSVIDIAQRGK